MFVPSGTTSYDSTTYSCQAFFMSDHEVTNFEYRQFLNHLKENNRKEDLKMCLPDSAGWNILKYAHNDPMVQLYHSHPAYDEYPVVNITKEAANLYCEYVTEQFRLLYGEQFINDVRLPSKLEWMYAAKGGFERSYYPWGTPWTRDDKGCFQANYSPIGDSQIIRDDNGIYCVEEGSSPRMYADGGFYTVSVKSYSPNNYGLFNMSGNVAEMVSDGSIAMGGHWYSTGGEIKVTSEEEYDKPSPFVGFRPVMSYIVK